MCFQPFDQTGNVWWSLWNVSTNWFETTIIGGVREFDWCTIRGSIFHLTIFGLTTDTGCLTRYSVTGFVCEFVWTVWIVVLKLERFSFLSIDSFWPDKTFWRSILTLSKFRVSASWSWAYMAATQIESTTNCKEKGNGFCFKIDFLRCDRLTFHCYCPIKV